MPVTSVCFLAPVTVPGPRAWYFSFYVHLIPMGIYFWVLGWWLFRDAQPHRRGRLGVRPLHLGVKRVPAEQVLIITGFLIE